MRASDGEPAPRSFLPSPQNTQIRPLPLNVDSIVNLATAGSFYLLVLSPIGVAMNCILM